MRALAQRGGKFMARARKRNWKTLPHVPGRAFEQISVDGVVLCFALGIAAFTGLVFGLAPALQVGARDLHDDLKSGGKGAGAAASSSKWLRNSLVVGEIALSLCLLIAAGSCSAPSSTCAPLKSACVRTKC
jgi:hypothetical protein